MLRFQHPEYLYALVLLPVFILLFTGMQVWRKNRIKKLGTQPQLSSQILGYIPGRATLHFILLAIAFTALVLGYANLQKSKGNETVQRKGVDVIIALDVSRSMLAQDIKPNRLARAQQMVMSLLDKMKNDRVGLIIFAGRAYLQVPLTVDYAAMRMMLQHVNPNMVPSQGTAIGEAIDLARNSFSQKEKKYKTLILISDGEDHEEQSLSLAEEAAQDGIIIHTIGIGSAEGATIQDPKTGTIKLDQNGNPVVSKLNESYLRSIATAGRGSYILLRNTDEAAGKLVQEINGMEQKQLGAVTFGSYSSYFQYFLVVALLALLVSLLLPESSYQRKLKTQKS